MQHRRLVVDANILIRGVLGQRVRRLVADACEHVAFYVAEANYAEAEHYLAQLAPARGITEDVWRRALDTLMVAIQMVGQEELAQVEAQAKVRIARDERDWPAVAAAMLLDCPIWTEDSDFFGTGVATWTTETVGLYLNSP